VMQRLVHEDKRPDNCATRGLHPNLLPNGWREVSHEEFSQSAFFTYSPTHIEYRQMYNDDTFSSKMISARLFHFSDGTGFAMSNDYWDKKVSYFRFGCEHNYRELSPEQSGERGVKHFGSCFHVYECNECNHIMSQDSSD